jgi:signal transduction histidine kinase
MSLLTAKKRSGSREVSFQTPRRIGTVPVVAIGTGFDPEAIRGRGGIGLVSMREPTDLVNGELSLDAKPGHGTRIKLALHLLRSAS